MSRKDESLRVRLTAEGGAELVLLFGPENAARYIEQRRHSIVGPKQSDFAAAMGLSQSQASQLLSGTVPFGRKQIERLNAIDSDFEIRPMLGVFRKTEREPRDGSL